VTKSHGSLLRLLSQEKPCASAARRSLGRMQLSSIICAGVLFIVQGRRKNGTVAHKKSTGSHCSAVYGVRVWSLYYVLTRVTATLRCEVINLSIYLHHSSDLGARTRERLISPQTSPLDPICAHQVPLHCHRHVRNVRMPYIDGC
jgi:hypothetical protein